MNQIFSEQETLARWQFYELFCTKYLIRCTYNEALSEDPWNADVLDSILHSVHPDNPLTIADIETIIQIVGMKSQGGLYFKYQEGTPVFPELILALSPYITTRAFVTLNQRTRGADETSVISFIEYCCHGKITQRYSPPDMYGIYAIWCETNKIPMVGQRAFYTRFQQLGFIRKKGYLDGRSGRSYYEVSIDEEKVFTHVQKDEKQKEPERVENPFKQVRDDEGARDKIRKTIILRRQAQISKKSRGSTNDEGEYDENGEDITYHNSDTDQGSSGSSTADSAQFENETGSDTRSDHSNGSGFHGEDRGYDVRGDSGYGAADQVIQVPEQGVIPEPQAAAETFIPKEKDPAVKTPVQRVKKLPEPYPKVLYGMKLEYRVTSKRPGKDEFLSTLKGAIPGAPDSCGITTDELYQLFMEYMTPPNKI